MPKEFEPNPEFLKEYWQARVEAKDDPRQVRVRGKLYWLGKDDPRTPYYLKGFGGAEFRIQFFDGREVITHDLWTNGEIPPEYREELPDNARFLDHAGHEVNEGRQRLDEKRDFSDIDKWLAEKERQREELKKRPWIPKWKWEKMHGIRRRR